MAFNFNWNYIKAGSPYVTISSNAISFNILAISQLKNPKFIQIGFDEENLVLGFKPTEINDPYIKTYAFSSRVNKDGWIRIGCKDFIKRLEQLTQHDYSDSKRFPTKLIEDNVLIIELSKNI